MQIESNDIKGRFEEIRELYGSGETESALNRLMDYIKDFCEEDSEFMDNCYSIKQDWSVHQDDVNKYGNPRNREYSEERRKIGNKILALARTTFNSLIN